MNLINKIKGLLNKRGANKPPVEPAVAHAPKNRGKEVLIGVVVLCMAGAGGWQWWSSKNKAAAPVNVAQAPIKPISPPQVVPPPAEVPNVASEVVISQPITVSQPLEAPTQEATPKESGPKEIEHEKEAATLIPSPKPETPPLAKAHAKPSASAGKHKHNNAGFLSAPDTANVSSDHEPGASSVAEGGVDKKVKPLSLQQQADNQFRKANGLMQQGRSEEALAGYEAALQLDAGHDAARQALVVLLLQNKRNADAERALQDGLKHNIKHSGFAMLLARIQVDRDAAWSALLTLQKTLPYAESNADYQAFVAALLQRLNRHKEAVIHYQTAVQLSPNSGVWWMGLGISQQALQRNEEARAAFKRALESHTLNADLQSYVSQQLKAL
jgi:MSHA biogenesis protein MshN